MNHVTFNDNVKIDIIPYENNINFDFIDALHRRHIIKNKWIMLLQLFLFNRNFLEFN